MEAHFTLEHDESSSMKSGITRDTRPIADAVGRVAARWAKLEDCLHISNDKSRKNPTRIRDAAVRAPPSIMKKAITEPKPRYAC